MSLEALIFMAGIERGQRRRDHEIAVGGDYAATLCEGFDAGYRPGSRGSAPAQGPGVSGFTE